METLLGTMPFPDDIKWVLQLRPNSEIEYFDGLWIRAKIKKILMEPVDYDKDGDLSFIQQNINWIIHIQTVNKPLIKWDINSPQQIQIRPISKSTLFWQSKFKQNDYNKLRNNAKFPYFGSKILGSVRVSGVIYYKDESQDEHIIINESAGLYQCDITGYNFYI